MRNEPGESVGPSEAGPNAPAPAWNPDRNPAGRGVEELQREHERPLTAENERTERTEAGGSPHAGGSRLDDVLLTIEKTAAAVAGALEGYRDRVREEHLGERVGEALETVRETRQEAQRGTEAWRTPELRRTGRAMVDTTRRAADRTANAATAAGRATAGAARSTADAARSTAERVGSTASDARSWTTDQYGRVRERTTGAYETARERTTSAYETARGRTAETVGAVAERAGEAYATGQEQVQYAAHEVKVKGQAVAESGRRATRAPGMIAKDVKQGVGEMTSNWVKAAALYASTALFGITVFILITIFLVVGLNELLGDPWGTLLTAILWTVVAGLVIWRAKALVGDAKTARKEMRERVREDVAYVGRPVRREFGGERHA